jgi:LuxR family maltose regulon positive regulatory protein
VARLNQGFLQRKLTLITAPTGFGKTTLLAEWLNIGVGSTEYGVGQETLTPYSLALRAFGVPTPRIAWLSLDKNDNNLAGFWTYVIAALRTLQPELGERSLSLLQSSHMLPIETMLIDLLNDVAARSGEFVLVLDDYHEIENPAIHQSLAFLLDQLPPMLHLVLLSRANPPLAVGHLRARGQLLELRASDLRFTAAETASFLNRSMGLNLSGEQIEILEAKTEGWIAGLQLAALSMQGRDAHDTSAFIAAFNGSHRYLLDYLAEEVLQRQPEHIQQFLLQTSILDRLCGPLCDAVIGRSAWRLNTHLQSPISNPQSQAVLEQLERANLFLMPLDDRRQWYRYHHLFADLLRSRLNQTQPEQVAELHRRAGAWYEQHGWVAAAMGHALAAGDVERAARLAEQHARTMFSRSELTTLLSWFKALAAETGRAQPRLSFFQAWALAFTGQLEAVEPYLQSLEVDSAEVAAIRATVAYLRRDMPQAIRLYRQALETLPPDNLFLRGAVALSLGIAHLWQGELREASQALSQASEISYATGNLHVALTAQWNLAQAHIELGQLRRAAELCRQALAWGQTQPLPPAVGGVHVALGSILVEQNELDEAGRHLEEGIKLGEQAADLAIVSLGQLALARVKQAQGDSESALRLVRKTEQVARQYNSNYWAAQAVTVQTQLWLAQGQINMAEQWAEGRTIPAGAPLDYLHELEYLTLVRLFLAQARQGQPLPEESISSALSLLREKAEEGGRTGRVLQVLVLQALADQLRGNLDRAITTLGQALRLAEPEGYIRLFVDEGEPMERLLVAGSQRPEAGHQMYLRELLASFKKVTHDDLPISHLASESLVEPLSERELEILRLIANGMSNTQIAEKIIVTVGTVKWHLNNIYGKLNVRSRTQAIARARELELL